VQRSTRSVVAVVTIAVLVLGVIGVVVALVEQHSNESNASLQLHGRPPRTANLSYTLDTGSRYHVDGTIDINFTPAVNRVRLVANIPLVFSTDQITALMAKDQILLSTPAIQQSPRPWIGVPAQTPDLSSLAQVFADPSNSALLSHVFMGDVTTTHHGSLTTYSVTHLYPLTPTIGTHEQRPPIGTKVTYAITVEGANQIADISIVATVDGMIDRADLHVNSYNRPTLIPVPPASQVRVVSYHYIAELLSGKIPITSLL
jgi:hypothetical protein